ncbi:hypothetical protein C2I18_27145 [Paenibacillus sp. PK3_47]|nr:hypothetical protein C2I18_27145 [Paenibacillus sp. PK3_47]
MAKPIRGFILSGDSDKRGIDGEWRGMDDKAMLLKTINAACPLTAAAAVYVRFFAYKALFP